MILQDMSVRHAVLTMQLAMSAKKTALPAALPIQRQTSANREAPMMRRATSVRVAGVTIRNHTIRPETDHICTP